MGCGCGKSSFSAPSQGARTSALPNTRITQGPTNTSVVRSLGVTGTGVNASPVVRRQV